MDAKLIEFLEKLRLELGVPLHIHSGYRCPEWNKAVGGVSSSFHIKAMAADISSRNLSPKQIGAKAEAMFGIQIGLGVYTKKKSFVHIDSGNGVKGKKRRWTG